MPQSSPRHEPPPDETPAVPVPAPSLRAARERGSGRAVSAAQPNLKVLIYSPAFHPQIGGLETATVQLAAGLHRAGVEVVVVTATPHRGPEPFSFTVVRQPSWLRILRWARWCDVFYQANVSVRGLWPLLLVRRPWVVSHHSWYRREDGHRAWQDRLKRFLLRFAAGSIAVSDALARDLATPSTVIPNGYRDAQFRALPGIERDRELVFLGRLVSEKGVDTLLDAMHHLGGLGLAPRLSVLGDGPELPRLRAQAERLGLAERVSFLGWRTGEHLVHLLHRHRVLVLPSRFDEPFGIAALEGIACGCVVVGSEGGGLQAAIGPCGRTFRNGDAWALAETLADVLLQRARSADYLRHAPAHLAEHTAERMVGRYLAVLRAAARR